MSSTPAEQAEAQSPLSPYVKRLFADVEDTLRRLLGLKPNVRIEHLPAQPGQAQFVDFRIHLPNEVTLEMRLAPPKTLSFALAETEQHALTYRMAPGADDPREDPVVGPCLDAVARLFRAQSALSGEALAQELRERREAIGAYAELSDDFYVRIFDGVMGVAANMRLGFRCNQDCGFCWQGRKWPEPPAEMFLTWLDELGRAGVRQLTLTGGEPTLHRALPDILDRAKDEYGMLTMLQTNAVQLRKPAVLERMVKARVDRLFVSFHAADAQTSDAMTRAPGTHVATVEGIRAALGAGLRVGLNCVVERSNHAALGEHARFIVQHFVEPFPDNPVESVNYSRPQAYHDRDLWQASLVPMDEVEPHLLEAVSVLRSAGVLLDVTAGSCGLPACLLRQHAGLIHLPQPANVGMADPAFDQEARERWACGRCALRGRCQGPGDGYLQAYGDRGLVPFEAMPEIATSYPLSLELAES